MRTRSKIRTLHLVGACWRRPGVGYQVGQDFGNKLPPTSAYHTACKNCFMQPRLLDPDLDGVAFPTTGSSSEDSPDRPPGAPSAPQ